MSLLLQGDSRHIPLKDESVALCVTSPPYNVGVKYDTWRDDKMTTGEYRHFLREVWTDCYRVLKRGGRIAVNSPCLGNSPQQGKGKGFIPHLSYMTESLIEAGFTLRETITWVKTNSDQVKDIDSNFCGNNTAWGSWNSPSNPFCRSFSEFIIVAHKETPKLPWRGHSDLTRDEFLLYTRNVWLMQTRSDPNHPAPFPEELPTRLIKLYTYIGDTVLDPFVGSGTTVSAATKLGRRGIGIDVSYNYLHRAQLELAQLEGKFELAQQLLRQAPAKKKLEDLPMFANIST